ncbi:MAG: hypothetical protein JWP01_2247 [Myxococcales bacterium]|nr:hypothetical protein [Myxococcales bacterium]
MFRIGSAALLLTACYTSTERPQPPVSPPVASVASVPVYARVFERGAHWRFQGKSVVTGGGDDGTETRRNPGQVDCEVSRAGVISCRGADDLDVRLRATANGLDTIGDDGSFVRLLGTPPTPHRTRRALPDDEGAEVEEVARTQACGESWCFGLTRKRTEHQHGSTPFNASGWQFCVRDGNVVGGEIVTSGKDHWHLYSTTTRFGQVCD